MLTIPFRRGAVNSQTPATTPPIPTPLKASRRHRQNTRCRSQTQPLSMQGSRKRTQDALQGQHHQGTQRQGRTSFVLVLVLLSLCLLYPQGTGTSHLLPRSKRICHDQSLKARMLQTGATLLISQHIPTLQVVGDVSPPISPNGAGPRHRTTAMTTRREQQGRTTLSCTPDRRVTPSWWGKAPVAGL